jgi:hypothetical protein
MAKFGLGKGLEPAGHFCRIFDQTGLMGRSPCAGRWCTAEGRIASYRPW